MTLPDNNEQLTLTKFPGFEHEGMHITNPTAEARGQVSPEVYGFEVVSTGGGCTAWARKIGEDRRVLLTNLMGSSHAFDGDEKFLLGLYDDTGAQLTSWEMKVGEVPAEDGATEDKEADYDVRTFLVNSFGEESAAKWTELLATEVLDCPVSSAVGDDAAEIITAGQGLIMMMADITESERKDIRIAVAHQCSVFYFG